MDVLTILSTAVAALVAALAEFGLHYFFHPYQGRNLSKIPAYVLGTLAWVLPLLGLLALRREAFPIVAIVAILIPAGTVVWLTNHYDHDRETEERAESESKIREACEDGHRNGEGCHAPHD